jgi:hypothetical protein
LQRLQSAVNSAHMAKKGSQTQPKWAIPDRNSISPIASRNW